jgi:hypothetical protein
MRVGPVLPGVVVAGRATAGLVIGGALVAGLAVAGVGVAERPARASLLVTGRAVAGAVLGRPRMAGFALVAVGALALPSVLGVLGLVARTAVGALGMCEHELRARLVTHRAVRAAIDVFARVTLRALGGRHVMAARTRNGDVTGEVGLPAVNHRRLGGVERGLGEGVVDASFLECAYAHVMADRGMACENPGDVSFTSGWHRLQRSLGTGVTSASGNFGSPVT